MRPIRFVVSKTRTLLNGHRMRRLARQQTAIVEAGKELGLSQERAEAIANSIIVSPQTVNKKMLVSIMRVARAKARVERRKASAQRGLTKASERLELIKMKPKLKITQHKIGKEVDTSKKAFEEAQKKKPKFKEWILHPKKSRATLSGIREKQKALTEAEGRKKDAEQKIIGRAEKRVSQAEADKVATDARQDYRYFKTVRRHKRRVAKIENMPTTRP
jgi:hypothetical protein